MGIPSAYLSKFTTHLRWWSGKQMSFLVTLHGANNRVVKSIPVRRFCKYSHSNSFQFYCGMRHSMSKYAKRCTARSCPAATCQNCTKTELRSKLAHVLMDNSRFNVLYSFLLFFLQFVVLLLFTYKK